MRTINGNIKVGGRSRQNQSIGLTHTEGKESLVTVNNRSAHQRQPILELLLVIRATTTCVIFSPGPNQLVSHRGQSKLNKGGQSKEEFHSRCSDFKIKKKPWMCCECSTIPMAAQWPTARAPRTFALTPNEWRSAPDSDGHNQGGSESASLRPAHSMM